MSHSRNPGWEAGNHWVVCDLCGRDFRHDEMLETWDGKIVCKGDFETRHPQDFVRARLDIQAAEGLVRSPPTDYYIFSGSVCTTNVAIAGEAIAGCAVVEVSVNSLTVNIPEGVPEATFG